MKQRTDRLNSLLREVISEVIRADLQHEQVSDLLTITRVDITKDLEHADVFISVIGNAEAKNNTLAILMKKAGPIAKACSKKVRMRIFPKLHFALDTGLDKHLRVQELLSKIENEREHREGHSSS